MERQELSTASTVGHHAQRAIPGTRSRRNLSSQLLRWRWLLRRRGLSSSGGGGGARPQPRVAPRVALERVEEQAAQARARGRRQALVRRAQQIIVDAARAVHGAQRRRRAVYGNGPREDRRPQLGRVHVGQPHAAHAARGARKRSASCKTVEGIAETAAPGGAAPRARERGAERSASRPTHCRFDGETWLPLSRVLPAYSPRSARLNHCGPGALAGMLAVRAQPAHARGRQRRSGGLLQGSCQKAQRCNGRDPSRAVFSSFF